MSTPLLVPKGIKKRKFEESDGICILCYESCNECHKQYTEDAWKNMENTASLWKGMIIDVLKTISFLFVYTLKNT